MLPFDAYRGERRAHAHLQPPAGNAPPERSPFYRPSNFKRTHAPKINHVYFPTNLKLFDTLQLIKQNDVKLLLIKVQHVCTAMEGLWFNTPVNILFGFLLAVIRVDLYESCLI